MNIFRRYIIWSAIGLVVAVAAVITLWNYVFSFQDATFHFDYKQGYIELVGDDAQSLYPRDNQPVKLKKGIYHARNIGVHIAEEPRTIQLDGSQNSFNISFNYTRAYLDQRLASEQAAIETALYTKYPAAQSQYKLENGKLYRQGEIYGATLVAREQAGDNTDTLHVLLQKDTDGWKVRSTPPTPILSAPLYRDIDRSILVDINQAK